MKTNLIQKEILLFTNSTFGQRQFCKKENDNEDNLTCRKNLEYVCANGLIKDLLPEVFNCNDDKMYLWHMHPGFSFLQLELGELPVLVEKRHSLDPHNFLETECYN